MRGFPRQIEINWESVLTSDLIENFQKAGLISSIKSRP